MSQKSEISGALHIAWQFGQVDGAHHKAWVIDQMVRALNGCPRPADTGDFGENERYRAWVRLARSGADGPETYEWQTGIAP